MKSLKVYLEESAKEYSYRIKMVEPITDSALDAIKYTMRKYDLLDISSVKKTPMQKHPMDFYDVDNREVYMVDIVTRLPASAYILQQELRKALAIPEKFIVVRSDNSPLETEGNRIVANQDMEREAREQGLSRDSMLDTESQYPEHEQGVEGEEYYGDNYNQKLNTYLAQVAAARQPQNYEAPEPLFSWLNMPEDQPWSGPENNFNDSFEYAPKPVEHWNVKDKEIDFDTYDKKTSSYGNFDDEYRTYSKSYTDPKTGEKKTLQRDNQAIREE